MERLERQLQFLMELDKQKEIVRQTYLADGSRKEGDAEGNKTKKARELKAADRIYGMLPEDQKMEYRSLWEEFEAMETPEAKFANMLDKVQPVLLNHASGGKSWREHEVRKAQILERNRSTHEGSEVLWEYARELIEENVKNGNIME